MNTEEKVTGHFICIDDEENQSRMPVGFYIPNKEKTNEKTHDGGMFGIVHNKNKTGFDIKYFEIKSIKEYLKLMGSKMKIVKLPKTTQTSKDVFDSLKTNEVMYNI